MRGELNSGGGRRLLRVAGVEAGKKAGHRELHELRVEKASSSGPAPGPQIERLTTSFMISFVPPKIRVTRASRHSLAIRYSFM